MSNADTVEQFIDALVAELERSLPADYIVQAREPDESELKVLEGVERQVFIILEGIEPAGEDIADGGESTGVRFILTVSCVMRRPRVLVASGPNAGQVDIAASVKANRSVNRRRRTIVEAIQRTRKQFANTHPYALTGFMEEVPRKVEDFSVSVTGVFIEYHMHFEE